jgi:uncharacterized protein YaiI (UPF0178 family)
VLKLWVDADAVPREVLEIVLRAARRLTLEVVLVANRRIRPPPGQRLVTAVQVAGGPDAADRHLVAESGAGDVAITADIPLAAELVRQGVHVIDPRGEEHTPDSIGERLSVRDYLDGLRGAGVVTAGARPFGIRERQAFAAALDRVLTRQLRAR